MSASGWATSIDPSAAGADGCAAGVDLELQGQLAKDSHNSSKPPSSDGLKKGKRKSLRRSGQRPRGGQRGRKGRTLMQVAEPDHVILHGHNACPHCQTELETVAAKKHVRRQVFDIPPARIESDRASGGGQAVSWVWCVREGRVSRPRDPNRPSMVHV